MSIKTRIYFLLYTIYIKWILKVRRRIRLLIFYKIQRISLANFASYKINTINDIASFFERYLIDGVIDDDKLEEINVVVDNIENVKLVLLENKDIRDLLSNYHRATHFYYSYGSSDYFSNEIDCSKKKAIKYNPEFEEFDKKSISELDKTIRKDTKFSIKENRAIIKKIIEKDVDEATPKLELDARIIIFVISLSTNLFLVTGYFYNKHYLGHFGIEVSDFYTIGDYLASSLDKISIAIFSALVAAGSYLAGMYWGRNQYIVAAHYNEQVKSNDILILISITAVSGMLVYATYINSPLAGTLMHMLLAFTSIAIVHIVPIERFISNDIQVKITLVAIAYFSISIYQGIKSEVQQLTDKEYKNPYTIVFSNDLFSEENDIRLIASTSLHYFIYIHKSSSAYVVKKSDVSIIKAKKGYQLSQ
jgi:predicted P-loop ATPase/GTPase